MPDPFSGAPFTGNAAARASAFAAAVRPQPASGQYDPAARRRAVRRGRERGCWVYIPKSVLAESGMPIDPVPWYRTRPYRDRSAVVVSFYREP